MRRQVNILSSTDWISVTFYLLLVVFGWINIFAVNFGPDDGSFFKLEHRYTMQLLFIIVSLLLILTIFILDSRFFSFIAYPAYWMAILSLLAVLVIGTAVNSSKSWIVIGPVSLQPSEFAKVATVLALAKYLSGYNIRMTRPRVIWMSLLIILIPVLLILIQPDFGSTIVYGILLLVLFREGLPGWVLVLISILIVLFLGTLILSQFLVLAILSGLAVIVAVVAGRKPVYFLISAVIIALFLGVFIILARFEFIPMDKYVILLYTMGSSAVVSVIIVLAKKVQRIMPVVFIFALSVGFTYTVDILFHTVMKEHQRNRVNVMLGLESDPYGYEYNVRQSKIAIGSGGFSGKGFLQGTQTKFRFVPEQSTDFIFCTVGEEWGFLGSFGLVLIFTGLIVRLIFMAERQRSAFGRIYGYGVVSVLFFHFAVNIGMTIGLFPVIGIPLPFLSYGGSSLLAFTIMLFIFIRLDASRKTYLI